MLLLTNKPFVTDFFKTLYFFRAVLSLQQNCKGGNRDFPYRPFPPRPAPPRRHKEVEAPPLSPSLTRMVHLLSKMNLH